MNKELALGGLLVLAWAMGRGVGGVGLEVASAPGGRPPSPWLSDMPFGRSPLTVRASIPAARTREAWKSLEAGSRERGVPHTGLWQLLWGIPETTDRLSRLMLA